MAGKALKQQDLDKSQKRVRTMQQRIDRLQREVKEYERKNQFFEMLISSLPGLFYLFDEDFKVHKWNKNVEEVIGYSSEEVTTRSLFELFDGEDLLRVQKSIQSAFTTGEGVVEADLVTKEGRRIPYFFTGATARIADTSYLLGMGLDISKRKQAEDGLRESEALYRIFAERMTEGVVLCHNSLIRFVNDAFVSMLAHKDSSRILGSDITSFVSKDFEIYFREMMETLEKGVMEERYFQARWMTKANQEIWVEGRGNLIQWQGNPTVLLTARDITETKQREISMQEEADHLRRENVNLRSSIKDRYRFGNIIGKSAAMQEVYELILDAAASSANLIIYGESGTGKELVARAIHTMSSRSANNFITVNCAAIPENLLESEFFGHKKGAFTGAHSDKQGYLDLADGGTLFLDEIGELGINLQAKLLRAIEGGGYSPVGSSLSKASDFRIIAATNRNLLDGLKKGLMREDFFYRIHIIPINLPPLRNRKDDIPLLLEHFLRTYAEEGKIPTVPGQIMDALIRYDWPGNVRELQNLTQRYIAVKRIDFLPSAAIVPAALQEGPEMDAADPAKQDFSTGGRLAEIEEAAIKKALTRFHGNKTRAAEALGISRKTLARKLKRMGTI